MPHNAKPVSTIFQVERPLDAIFAPRSVAVVGATDKSGSVGRTILWNLIGSPFGGMVFPVNPKRSSVLGIRAAGAALEQQILTEAHRGSMRIVGPTCLGVMSPVTGLNALVAEARDR